MSAHRYPPSQLLLKKLPTTNGFALLRGAGVEHGHTTFLSTNPPENRMEPEIDWGDDADVDLLEELSEAEACSLENPESCETCQ